MGSLGSLLLLGLALGMRHATDADHVVAVSAIAARERSARSAVWVGLSWGLGHALTLLVVGGAILLLGIAVPPRLGLGLELVVAAVLIALGFSNLGRFTPHGHEHCATGLPRTPRGLLKSLGVGVAHGLAGSAAVALLVLATIQSVERSLLYLFVFAFGTAFGMVLLTSLFALPLSYTSRRFGNLQRELCRAAGVLSLGFGLLLVYRIGFVEGLFTGNVAPVASVQE
jgi:high-affinity nickel permease